MDIKHYRVIINILAAAVTMASGCLSAPLVRPRIAIHPDRETIAALSDSANISGSETLNLDKAMTWQLSGRTYYLLLISSPNDNSCRISIIDSTSRIPVSDGDFSYAHCRFTRSPESFDLNGDGISDIRVWINLPHPSNENILVEHSLDFVFDGDLEMFCESTLNIPCNMIETR